MRSRRSDRQTYRLRLACRQILRESENAQYKKAEKDRNDLRSCPARVLRRILPPAFYDLMVFEAASHVTGFWRKYDSFAM